jgi:hypothetical protein
MENEYFCGLCKRDKKCIVKKLILVTNLSFLQNQSQVYFSWNDYLCTLHVRIYVKFVFEVFKYFKMQVKYISNKRSICTQNQNGLLASNTLSSASARLPEKWRIHVPLFYNTRKYARALHRERKLILRLGATRRENSYHDSAQCIFYHFLPHSVIIFGTCISKHFCP